MTHVEHNGLTHECVDPDCHVPGFAATLVTKRDAEVSSLRMQYEASQGALSDLLTEHREDAEVHASRLAAVEALAAEIIEAGTPYTPGSFADGIRCGAIETARRVIAALASVSAPDNGKAER